MKILRGKRQKNFTIMANKVIYDDQLSYRALGLLTYLLSKPDGWETDSSRLSEGRKEGRDAVRTAMAELKKAGYLVHRRVQDKGSGRWTTVAELTDEPEDGFPVVGVTSTNRPSSQVGPTTGKPTVGYPDVGKPGATSKDADQGLRVRTGTEGWLPPDPRPGARPPDPPRHDAPPGRRTDQPAELTAVPDHNDTKQVTSQTRTREINRPLLAIVETEYPVDDYQLTIPMEIPPPTEVTWADLGAQLARINGATA